MNAKETQDKPAEPSSAPKEHWSTPKLTVHGDVGELTRTNTHVGADGACGSQVGSN